MPLKLTPNFIHTLNSFFQIKLVLTPNNQLKVEVQGTVGASSRFVADDSLSIIKLHRASLILTIRKPVISSLQNNGSFLIEEF